MYVLTTDYTQSNAAAVFVKSLQETGFGVLKNHPIDFKLIKEINIEWENFFNSKSKFDYLHDKEKGEGFFPSLSEKDSKEYYHLYAWGRYPEMLSQRTRDLFHQVNKLAVILLEWIELCTPNDIKAKFSLPLSEMIQDSPRTLLRILYHPPFRRDEEMETIRAVPHEDIDLLTIVPAATPRDLQVKDSQGKWHDVETDPGAIIINSGSMLQLCSNGYFHAPIHRVINPIGEDRNIPRFFMPLFLYPRDEVRLTAEHTSKTYLLQKMQENNIGVV